MSADIYITSIDRERIKETMDKIYAGSQAPDKYVAKLEDELSRARLIDSQHVPQDIITMNSKVLLQIDDDDDIEVSLVYPEDADLGAMKLSIFSPIGTAILGYKEGSIIDWEVPSGISKIYIKKVLYQPEAAGNYRI